MLMPFAAAMRYARDAAADVTPMPRRHFAMLRYADVILPLFMMLMLRHADARAAIDADAAAAAAPLR